MQSNFSFLEHEWPSIMEQAVESERTAITAPVTSVFYARLCLETMVNWLYGNEASLHEPYTSTLGARMAEPTFRDLIPPSIYGNIDYIRRQGNIAVHKGKVGKGVSLASLRFLFRFVSWVAKMYSETPPVIPEFDEGLIPRVGAKEKSVQALQTREAELAVQVEEAKKERARR